ncbi:MAG TPA: class I SAM-dependent methyltransferase [Candidatus Angelobacter sp.]|nr:class I SAM-dependent methyltransferase [Candidatus Angelobacter sp.]
MMASAIERSIGSFKQRVKSRTARPFWLRYATLAPYRILCAGASALTGLTRSGARHASGSVENSVAYIASVFSMYKAASGVKQFHGKVAEIGPGDSCGIGLMFLADGCEQVDLVDRFFSARDEQHQQRINRSLAEKLPQLAALCPDGSYMEASFRHLARHYGESAAAETFFTNNRDYDYIVSCAVLEHVYDPLGAMTSAASALKPGGMMLHQIDCRDHGQFSESFHELKFLELPERLYSPLKWRGGPNRVRLSAYCDVLVKMGLDFEVYVNSMAGISEEISGCLRLQDIPETIIQTSRRYVESVRHRLTLPFRAMSDEDLMITRFLVVARKPAALGSGQ